MHALSGSDLQVYTFAHLQIVPQRFCTLTLPSLDFS
jgi:hypothetical protein